MLDLTVEIDGDISSLDEALVRFTSTEVLDGENRYHCSRFLCLLIFSFYLLSLCLTVFLSLLIFKNLGDHALRPLLNLNKTKGALQHCLLILKRTYSQLHNILFWLLRCGLEILYRYVIEGQLHLYASSYPTAWQPFLDIENDFLLSVLEKEEKNDFS